MNTESGWKALTGTPDFGLVTKRAQEGSEADRLAFDLFVDRVLNYVGSYHLKLGGRVDAVVFSGGIGERSPELRKVIGDKLQCLGFHGVADSGNKAVDKQDGAVVDITAQSASDKRLLVCRTDEQVCLSFVFCCNHSQRILVRDGQAVFAIRRVLVSC